MIYGIIRWQYKDLKKVYFGAHALEQQAGLLLAMILPIVLLAFCMAPLEKQIMENFTFEMWWLEPHNLLIVSNNIVEKRRSVDKLFQWGLFLEFCWAVTDCPAFLSGDSLICLIGHWDET